MKITPEQSQGPSVEPPNSAANTTKSEKAFASSPVASTVPEATSAASTNVVTPVQRQTDVTFRRDTNGRVYYVVSDAQSGQEILEVPPKTVREVGEGIEDYLKKERSKTDSHIEVKA